LSKAIEAGRTIARKGWILVTRAVDYEAEANPSVEEDTPERYDVPLLHPDVY